MDHTAITLYKLTARMHKIAGVGSDFQNFSQVGGGGDMPRIPWMGVGFSHAEFGPPDDNKNPRIITSAYGYKSLMMILFLRFKSEIKDISNLEMKGKKTPRSH